MDKQIIIIGSGIAAKCVIFQLNKKGFKNILCIANDIFAPACTHSSTAINALRGTERGLSPLGNTLIDSHEVFSQFYEKYNPAGVFDTYEVHGWFGENAKLKRRYHTYNNGVEFEFFNKKLPAEINYTHNQAYVISPKTFLNWIEEQLEYTAIEDYVTEVHDNFVSTQNGDKYKFDTLVIATGFMAKNFESLVQSDELRKNLHFSKPVSGSFLEFEKSDFEKTSLSFKESFSFVFEDAHFIYRKDVDKIIIGSTSSNNLLDFNHNKKLLEQRFEKIKMVLGESSFPSFDKAKFFTGIRHKSQNRKPFYGKINSNTYAIWGMYKTGWSCSFLAAHRIITEFLSEQ